MQDVERAQVISAVDTKKKACSNERLANEIQSEPEKSLEEITVKEVVVIANKIEKSEAITAEKTKS